MATPSAFSPDSPVDFAAIPQPVLQYSSMLSSFLQPRHWSPEAIRAVLTRAVQEGLDPEIIYALTVRLHPRHWPTPPPYEAVAPATTPPSGSPSAPAG